MTGPEGPEGSPWTAGGTLPPGATETGSWSFDREFESFETEVEGVKKTVTIGNHGPIHVPISFPIPLKGTVIAGVGEPVVNFVESGGEPSQCTDETGEGSTLFPKADPGELCVYASSNGLPETSFIRIAKVSEFDFATGANTAGAMLVLSEPTGNTSSWGTFALTAPEPEITGVSPNHGPAGGGTSVTITGKNLRVSANNQNNLNKTVKFGSEFASEVTVNGEGTEITCKSPAHAAGAVDVTVNVSGYLSPTTSADVYTYE